MGLGDDMKEQYLSFSRMIKNKETEEEICVEDRVELREIQSLYKDKYATWIVLNNGSMIKTAHKLSELEGFIYK